MNFRISGCQSVQVLCWNWKVSYHFLCIQMITIFQYTFSPYPKVLRDYGSSWWEMIRFGFGTTLHFNWHGKRHIATCQCISVCSMGCVDCCRDPYKINGYLIPFCLCFGRVCCQVHEHPPQELVSRLTMSPRFLRWRSGIGRTTNAGVCLHAVQMCW